MCVCVCVCVCVVTVVCVCVCACEDFKIFSRIVVFTGCMKERYKDVRELSNVDT